MGHKKTESSDRAFTQEEIRIFTAMKYFKPCHGYENGKTTNQVDKELAKNLFPDVECKPCRLMRTGHVLSKMRKYWEGKVYCPKAPSKGMPRKYYHLQDISDFQKVINRFEAQIRGIEKRKDELESLKVVVENKRAAEEQAKELRELKKKVEQ